MLANRTNPSCCVSFRYLKDGRLFRLERDPTLSSKSNRVEYFWLGHRCSSETTLRLREDGTVATVLPSESIRCVRDDVTRSCADRKAGSLLRSVTSVSPEHVRSRMRTRLKDVASVGLSVPVAIASMLRMVPGILIRQNCAIVNSKP